MERLAKYAQDVPVATVARMANLSASRDATMHALHCQKLTTGPEPQAWSILG